MNKITLLWSRIAFIFILTLITATSLNAKVKLSKQVSGHFPFDMVTKYLGERVDATTYQNKKAEAKLLGKQYEGIVTVFDVVEFGDDDLMIYGWQETGRGAELRFLIQSPNNKEIAGALRRRNSIHIIATLEFFYNKESGYMNVSDTYIASFKDVKKLELLPK